MNITEIRPIVEALLFLNGDGLSSAEIAGILEVDCHLVEQALECLTAEYNSDMHGIMLVKMSNIYQFRTKPICERYVLKLLPFRQKQGLSAAVMETLAIVLYHQPVTRAKVEHLRGVNSDGCIAKLVDRGLVEEAGRSEDKGRPILYRTSKEFLKTFGLSSCKQLIEEMGMQNVEKQEKIHAT